MVYPSYLRTLVVVWDFSAKFLLLPHLPPFPKQTKDESWRKFLVGESCVLEVKRSFISSRSDDPQASQEFAVSLATCGPKTIKAYLAMMHDFEEWLALQLEGGDHFDLMTGTSARGTWIS